LEYIGSMNTNISVSTSLAAEIAGIGYEGFRTWLKRGLLKATGILPNFYAPDAPAEIADAKRWRWAAFGYADLCSFRLAKNLLDAGLPWDTVNPIVSDYTLWQSHQADDSDGRHLVIQAGGTEWGIYTTKSLIDQLDSETRKRDWAILIDLRDLRNDVVLRCRAASLKAVATDLVQTSHIFARSGANLLPPQEVGERKHAIEQLAGEIDALATKAAQGGGSYAEFEVILRQLHTLGKFPEGPAVSAVAASFVLQHGPL
jgi:hypothetical protein